MYERDSSLTMISGRHVSAAAQLLGSFEKVLSFFFILPFGENSSIFFLLLFSSASFFKDRNFTRLYASVSYYAVSYLYIHIISFIEGGQVFELDKLLLTD